METRVMIYDPILGLVPGTEADAFTWLGVATLQAVPPKWTTIPGMGTVLGDPDVELRVATYGCQVCGALVPEQSRGLHLRSHGSEVVIGVPDGD